MKKLLIILAATVMSTFVASAQFMNNNTSASTTTRTKAVVESPSSFGTLSIAYHPMTIKNIYDGDSTSETFNGLSLDWTNANKISSMIPLYVEYGLGAQWSFKKESKNDYTVTTNFLSVKAPISLLYNLQIPGTAISIAPYAGFDAVVYALGKVKGKYKGETEEEDIFKSDGDDRLNRFQIDWHIGGKIFINKFFINAAYEGPILGFYNKDGYKINSRQANLGLGFMF